MVEIKNMKGTALGRDGMEREMLHDALQVDIGDHGKKNHQGFYCTRSLSWDEHQ